MAGRNNQCIPHDGKLLIAGNGGSAADSEHITGKPMKRFKTPRPVPQDFAEKLKTVDFARGEELARNLEHGLMAIFWWRMKRRQRSTSTRWMDSKRLRSISMDMASRVTCS